jgi:hypothetical protein
MSVWRNLVRLYGTLFAREPSSTESGECCRFVAACMDTIGVKGQEGKPYSPLTVSKTMIGFKPEEKWGPIGPA